MSAINHIAEYLRGAGKPVFASILEELQKDYREKEKILRTLYRRDQSLIRNRYIPALQRAQEIAERLRDIETDPDERQRLQEDWELFTELLRGSDL